MMTFSCQSLLHQRSNLLPEQEPWREENVDLRRRGKYLRSCKDQLWRRWTREYLTALRKRQSKPQAQELQGSSIKAKKKNRNKWPMGVVQQLYPGHDGVVRAVQVDTGKGQLERPIQHLYPLELSCDREGGYPSVLNPQAEAFRPRRKAATVAGDGIRAVALQELDS